jgi:hypothetical protein
MKSYALFSSTTAEYYCMKCRDDQRSLVGTNVFSRFHLIAAATATVPLWLLSLRAQYPWYCFVSVLAGELLLLILAGFLIGFLRQFLMFFTRTLICNKCGARMELNGRNFDPLGSTRPHWSDILLFAVFIGLNIWVWISIANGSLWNMLPN